MDAERLLGNLLGGTLSRALGGRGSSIFRGGSLTSRANLGVGLLGLAMAAFEHYQQQSRHPAAPPAGGTPPPPPANDPAATPQTGMPPPPPPPASPDRQADAIVLIRAMIAAAQSDGRIDDDERSRIMRAATGLSQEERAFLDRELASPHSIEQLAAASRPEIATEIYAAASHAIVADGDAERAWLYRLADALHLDAATRQTLDRQLASR
jgi:uncharacterized membrane protein YebE (DUF533 family)